MLIVLGASLGANALLGMAFFILWKVHRSRIEEKSKRVRELEEKLVEGRLSSGTPPAADKLGEGKAGETEPQPTERAEPERGNQ